MATLVFKVGTGAASYSNSYSVDLESSSDQYLEASGSSAFDLSTYGESFSISMWVKPESLPSDKLLTMVSKGNAFRAYVDPSNFRVFVGPTSTGPSENAYISNGGSATGVWHHVVMTYDGNSLNDASFVASGQFVSKIYRNATAGTSYRAQYVGRLTNSTSATNSNTFQIGGSDTNTSDPFLSSWYSSFDGAIDEVSYWNKALSSSEVTELYNSGSAADLSSHSAVSNLVSWWRMGDNASDDLTADTGQITDVEGSNNLIPRNTTSSSKVEDTPGS